MENNMEAAWIYIGGCNADNGKQDGSCSSLGW